MNGLISVIVPIYRVEAYLDRCVESIVRQTYQNLEIILVDDGSPDACPEMCDAWGQKDARVTVIHKENGGLGKARNAALEIVRGDYISFVDSDDYLPEDALEVMYHRIRQDKSQMVIGQMVTEYADGQQKGALRDDAAYVLQKAEAFALLGTENSPVHCCACGKLYERHIFEDLRFLPLRHSEDLQLFPLILDRCAKVSIIPNSVYFYVQRETSISHTMDDGRYLDAMLARLLVSDFFQAAGAREKVTQYDKEALYMAYQMKHKKQGRTLFNQHFGKRGFKNRSLKTWIGWLGLYIPIYSIAKALSKHSR